MMSLLELTGQEPAEGQVLQVLVEASSEAASEEASFVVASEEASFVVASEAASFEAA